MRVPIPRAPDILTPWRAQILAALAEAGIAADVGPKRPASTTNLEGRFVRIMCLGGAWDARALWHPRLATESWAPNVLEARELDAIVAQATARFEGYEQLPIPTSPVGFFVSSLALDLQGSDQSLDGAPFVLTTTEALCVSVTQYLAD